MAPSLRALLVAAAPRFCSQMRVPAPQDLFQRIVQEQQVAADDPEAAPETLNQTLAALVALVAAGLELEDDDAKMQEDEAPSGDVDLVALLVESHVSLRAFLRQFSWTVDRLALPPKLSLVATHVKEEFTIASVLFEKYKILWPTVQSVALKDASETRMQSLFEAGWLLFLIVRRRKGDQYVGLAPLYFLLLGVLQLVGSVATGPSLEAEVAAALSALGNADNAKSSRNELDQGLPELLTALCATPQVDESEVTRAHAQVTRVAHVLMDEQVLRTAAASASSPRTALFSVFHSDVLAANAQRVSEHYAQTYIRSWSNLDERLYLHPTQRQIIVGPQTQQPKQQPSPSHASAAPTSSTSSRPLPLQRPSNPRLVLLSPQGSRNLTPRRDSHGPPRTGTPTMPSLGGGPPASPFTGQAWQWNGASPPPSLSMTMSRSITTPKTRAFLQAANQPSSPFVMQTPVRTAVEINHWVRETVTTPAGHSEVSPQLKQYFADCNSDPSEHIARILEKLSQKLLASRRRPVVPTRTGAVVRSLPTEENDDEDQDMENHEHSSMLESIEYSKVDGSLKLTQTLAVALFYRVLEELVRSERERLQITNFSTLLHNETFASSLFACSVEVMLKAHGLITLSFPFLLDNIGVNAFDFGKIIESFVKHMPSLPNVLKRHMRDLEQVVLNSLAWRSDSGLYLVLAGDTKAHSSSNNNNGSSVVNSGTVLSEPTTSKGNGGGRTSVLQLFFRKVLSLAASRIYRLGSILGLEAKFLNQVWTAIKECLSTQHHLLKDRHLDQIVLCSLYGVCKVNHIPNVSFKRVVEGYKELLNSSQGDHTGHRLGNSHGVSPSSSASTVWARNYQDVIRNIKLDDSSSRGDIITFYNRCYLPTMKVFLLQFRMQDQQMAAAADAVQAATGAPSASPPPPGFTPRRDGSIVTASSSDIEIVAEAAATAVEKVMQSYGRTTPRTPSQGDKRPARRISGFSSPIFGSPSRTPLQLFSSTEVESLPVSVHHSSPKRVPSSNIYMSPLQQARLHNRTELTPRSHALYAFGESPSRVRLFLKWLVIGLLTFCFIVGPCADQSRSKHEPRACGTVTFPNAARLCHLTNKER